MKIFGRKKIQEVVGSLKIYLHNENVQSLAYTIEDIQNDSITIKILPRTEADKKKGNVLIIPNKTDLVAEMLFK